MGLYEKWQRAYEPYAQLVGWLSVLSVFVPMMAVYWETCSGRFLVLLSTIITLWVVEVIPLWVTALSIPVQVVLFRVMAKDGITAMTGREASRVLFAGIFGSVPLTLLAIFTLAEALKLHGPIRLISRKWLYHVAESSWPLLVLLVMLTVPLISVVAGNISTVDALLAILSPLLHNLPSNSPQSRMLFGGLLISGSIGGLGSPIASAHAIFGFDLAVREGYATKITWHLWVLVAMAIMFLVVILSWTVIFIWYIFARTSDEKLKLPKEERPVIIVLDDQSKGNLTTVCLLYGLTIIGWILTGSFGDWIGELGIVSLVPVVVIFGTGLLDNNGLARIPWHVILLTIGGSALSVAAEHSGYLQHLAGRYLSELHWSLFILIPTIFSVYKSQLVTALLFLPSVIASNQGLGIGRNEAAIRYFLTFLGSSLGMALPISGMISMVFDNEKDVNGEGRVSMRDYLLFGMIGTIIACLVVLAIGKPLLERLVT